MSSPNLLELASDHREQRILEGLQAVLRENEAYDFDRLVDLVRPESEFELRLLLGKLVRAGHLRILYRVLSPEAHGGIRDFDSLDEVPETIDDWRVGRQIDVNAENIRALYELGPAHV